MFLRETFHLIRVDTESTAIDASCHQELRDSLGAAPFHIPVPLVETFQRIFLLTIKYQYRERRVFHTALVKKPLIRLPPKSQNQISGLSPPLLTGGFHRVECAPTVGRVGSQSFIAKRIAKPVLPAPESPKRTTFALCAFSRYGRGGVTAFAGFENAEEVAAVKFHKRSTPSFVPDSIRPTSRPSARVETLLD